MPLVSIISPSYNSILFISKTIESVISSRLEDWEMIIVDDCSSDNSVEVIQSFVAQDARIKLIQLTENSGAAVARNAGIESAKGRYIAFLDSDDIWLPHKLETQLEFMQKNNYPFVFTAYDKIDEEGNVIGHIGVPKNVTYHELLKTNVIGCLTAVYDTRYFGKVFMPLNTKREDYALWLNLLKTVECAHGINSSLSEYRVYEGQSSSKKRKMAVENWKLYRSIEGLGILTSVYYILHYTVRGVLRTKVPGLARKLGVLN